MASLLFPDPLSLQALLADNTSALPYLGNALLQHLTRYPALRNGLGHVENKALELIGSGYNEFGLLFHEFGAAEPIYGLGDAQFYNDLQRMINIPKPLLTTDNITQLCPAPDAQPAARIFFKLTLQGVAVMEGKADFIELNGIDLWLGGVHLFGKENLWRWDERNKVLVKS